MRLIPSISLIAAAVTVGSCTGTGINDKPVYDAINGTTKLSATVTDTSTAVPTSATFSVDDKPLNGQVTASGSTFSVDFDSTTVANGVHTVKAVGEPGDVELLNATIYVSNNGTGGTATTAPTGTTGQ